MNRSKITYGGDGFVVRMFLLVLLPELLPIYKSTNKSNQKKFHKKYGSENRR